MIRARVRVPTLRAHTHTHAYVGNYISLVCFVVSFALCNCSVCFGTFSKQIDIHAGHTDRQTVEPWYTTHYEMRGPVYNYIYYNNSVFGVKAILLAGMLWLVCSFVGSFFILIVWKSIFFSDCSARFVCLFVWFSSSLAIWKERQTGKQRRAQRNRVK